MVSLGKPLAVGNQFDAGSEGFLFGWGRFFLSGHVTTPFRCPSNVMQGKRRRGSSGLPIPQYNYPPHYDIKRGSWRSGIHCQSTAILAMDLARICAELASLIERMPCPTAPSPTNATRMRSSGT